MADSEQITDLGEGDWGLESVDLGLLEGVAGGEDPDCGTQSKARTSSGKTGGEASTTEKKRPLNLLDLPVDVLKDIIKEVRGVTPNAFQILILL